MGPVKVYKCLSIAEKKKVIAAVEAGEKKKDVALRFGIPASTLSTILKQKDHLTTLTPYSSRIRQKKCEYPDLEECLMAWFTQSRQNNIPISGPILKEKSKLFATNLGITNFQASEGWLEKFKKRHDLTFKKVCGESASVDQCISQDWKNELINLLVDYDARDIFNADETGLFYKCLPDRTLTFKNEKCHGGKNSKERITVMLAANMDGSQKLKPLMIGKFANPRCFKNVKSFPLMYRSNKKAWMTGVLFTEWLLCIDVDMKKANRKILMFVDNCTAHNNIPHLENIKIHFLPPNTTSTLQPLDQGIIKNFKTMYRKEIVREVLECIGEVPCKISILTAMEMVHKAWENVSAQTIANCFRTCGFIKDGQTIGEGIPVQCEEVERTWNRLEVPVSFEEFVHFDDNVATAGTFTDEEIIQSTSANQHNSDNDDEEEEAEAEAPVISLKEAKFFMSGLRKFFEQSEMDEKRCDTIFNAISKLDNAMDQIVTNNFSQKKITDFFKM
jgi:hypothetical protein